MALKSDQNIYLNNGLFVFLVTFLGYHFLRHIAFIRGSISTASAHYHLLNNHYKKMITLYTITGTIIIYLLANLRSYNFSYFMIAIMLFMLYEQVFTTRLSLRRIPFLKNFIIASTWSLVIMGMQEDPRLIIFLDIFFFIFILCLPFDFKDIIDDKQHHIITFANKLKHFEWILLALYTLYSAIFLYKDETLFCVIGLIIFAFATYSLRKLSQQTFYLIFDGLIILRFLLYLF